MVIMVSLHTALKALPRGCCLCCFSPPTAVLLYAVHVGLQLVPTISFLQTTPRCICPLQDWVVLGGVDLEEYVDANLVEVCDWELNLRMLKAAARDAERLPNEVSGTTWADCLQVCRQLQ